MCNECKEEEVPKYALISEYPFIKIVNHFRINIKADEFHCLTGPARLFYKKDNSVQLYWYIADKWVIVDSQKEFEKSKEYREWKLKAFK